MSEERFDKGRKIVAVISIIGLIAVIIALSFSDRVAKPMPINGDVLGQDNSESLEEYKARADASLEAAPAEKKAYALITFNQTLSASDASGLLSGIGRVSAMVMKSAAPMALPEPIAGEAREDVFNRQFDQVARGLSGIGNVEAPREMNGVVVWDEGYVLHSVARDTAVFAVEVLPPDAVWGNFGVRPVSVAQASG